MMPARFSACGRFVVLDGLHLDRNLFESLARWAAERQLRLQDAIQLALCAFRECAVDRNGADGTELPTKRALGTGG
jgi:hypothetical protein